MNSRQRSEFVERIAVILAVAGMFALFYHLSLNRLIARDEGFYVLAAKLSAQGKRLYADFFFPQMPLVPHLYGIWMKLTGFLWSSARTLSALLAAGTGVLLYYRCNTVLGRRYGLAALIIFSLSSTALCWYSTVQTYAASTFFLFAFYVIISAYNTRGKALLPFASGVMFGLAVNARLFFIGLLPLVYIQLRKHETRWQEMLKPVIWFQLGFAAALLPALYLIFHSPGNFWFDNLGYHLMRSDNSAGAEIVPKLKILGVLLGLRETRKFDYFEFPLLFYLSCIYALFCIKKRSPPDLALYAALGLFLLNFLPSPAYVQYFCTLIPFLIVCTLTLLKDLFILLPGNRARILQIAGGPIIVFFCITARSNIYKYTVSGKGVTGVGAGKDAAFWSIDGVNRVATAINRYAGRGKLVASDWPGYLLESGAQPFPGLENQFGIIAADKLDPVSRKKYRLISKSEISAAISSAGINTIVLRKKNARRHYKAALKAGGYVLKDQTGEVNIYHLSE